MFCLKQQTKQLCASYHTPGDSKLKLSPPPPPPISMVNSVLVANALKGEVHAGVKFFLIETEKCEKQDNIC